ncbi:S8 family serine peptidase [Flavobacterium sp.]|jgi:minor extracellular serine protease Vpr|uniref:S8 family serine peptidase n=1 Tax=Flavobacterium sp. TaxID=239 RepID=UPI0037BF8FE9
MKNKITLLLNLLMLSISINVFSQNTLKEKTGKPTPPSFNYERPLNCALNTSFLMMDIKQNKDAKYLKERYNLTELNSQLFVDAFVKISDAFDKSKVELLGVELNTKVGEFYTARIPINKLEELFSINGVIKVEIAERVYQTLDNARALTNVNQVQAGTGLPQAYTGNGVIVGMIDSGFDYTHPTFRNLNTQQTRISRVWEQTESGTPPSNVNYSLGTSYGNEIIGASNILANANDNVNGVSQGSHGTHTTGIAAGTGGITNSLYKGIAYDSEIVLVPTDRNTAHIFDGIQYIFNYATSVNKPVVINMSLGSHLGPHDGTSTFDSMCNSIVGPGKILVGSAGNEGGDNIHVNKTLSTGNSLFSFIAFPYSQINYANGKSNIDIWGEAGKSFEVAVNIYNIVTNQFESYTPYINTQTNSSYQGTIYDNDTTSAPDTCSVTIATENSNSNNTKPHATIVIDNSLQDDALRYVLIEVRSSNGVVNAWNFPDGKFSDLSELNINVGATNGNTNMTIGEIGGTGNSIISVGAYTSKNTYTNILGSSPSLDYPGTIGSIASFSSKGPTVDGRIKPDITAPGNVVVSSVSRFDNKYLSGGSSWNNVVSGLTDNTNNWYFGAMQGTSMAAPVVTGIIALWLQAKPNLTVDQIKTIIHTTSITDSFTGTGSYIPNNFYGWGKINAYAGIQYINQFLNVDTFDTKNNFIVHPNPTSSKVFITSKEYVSSYEIYNTLGQKVKEGSFNAVLEQEELDLTTLQNGLYILNFKGEKVDKTVRIVKQ